MVLTYLSKGRCIRAHPWDFMAGRSQCQAHHWTEASEICRCKARFHFGNTRRKSCLPESSLWRSL